MKRRLITDAEMRYVRDFCNHSNGEQIEMAVKSLDAGTAAGWDELNDVSRKWVRTTLMWEAAKRRPAPQTRDERARADARRYLDDLEAKLTGTLEVGVYAASVGERGGFRKIGR